MEDLILISNLNDFIFCPVSIYFHKLYGNQDNLTYFDNVQWNGRKPRIKSDYVNVVLDIGYTMLFNIVDAMLQVYGFDTYYGVFHKCFYMRKSLVCDIMEPIRPIIDYEVRKAINLGQCKIDDFEKSAFYVRDFIIQDMASLRKPCDKLEVITSNSDWPFPTYGKLLFGIQ